MAMDDGEISTVHLADDFLEELLALTPQVLPKVDPAPMRTPTTNNLEQLEMATILRVMEACAGNVSMASKQLNISRNTLYRRLGKVI